MHLLLFARVTAVHKVKYTNLHLLQYCVSCVLCTNYCSLYMLLWCVLKKVRKLKSKKIEEIDSNSLWNENKVYTYVHTYRFYVRITCTWKYVVRILCANVHACTSHQLRSVYMRYTTQVCPYIFTAFKISCHFMVTCRGYNSSSEVS